MSKANQCQACKQERMTANGARFRRGAVHTCQSQPGRPEPTGIGRPGYRLKHKADYEEATALLERLSASGKTGEIVSGVIENLKAQINAFEEWRDALLAKVGISESGYGGMLPTGEIVDRREHPTAIPLQFNSMFNIPVPKKL